MWLLQGTIDEFQNAGMFDNIMLRGYFLDDRDDEYCDEEEECNEEDDDEE